MGEHKLLMPPRGGLAALCLALAVSLAGARPPFDHLKDFCSLGERTPGTAGHLDAKDYIVRNLKNADVDSFFERGTWLYNISRTFEGGDRIIGIGAHWDSEKGSPGANDGGSGVALLLSLADSLEKNPPAVGVEIVLFDGEDIGDAELLGSLEYASSCVRNFSFFLVVDMVCDQDLVIHKEGNSYKFFPELVDSIWEIGADAAPGVFRQSVKYYVKDDHMALIRYGIRAIDIIDFDYPYWHTKDDTIDKCSRNNLDEMFRFLLRIVYPPY